MRNQVWGAPSSDAGIRVPARDLIAVLVQAIGRGDTVHAGITLFVESGDIGDG